LRDWLNPKKQKKKSGAHLQVPSCDKTRWALSGQFFRAYLQHDFCLRTPMTDKSAPPGSFLAIGRRDDTNEIVVSTIEDVPLRPKLSQLCHRVLREMGQRDPLVYEFIALVYAGQNGGCKLALDQATLRRFVYANWGRARK